MNNVLETLLAIPVLVGILSLIVNWFIIRRLLFYIGKNFPNQYSELAAKIPNGVHQRGWHSVLEEKIGNDVDSLPHDEFLDKWYKFAKYLRYTQTICVALSIVIFLVAVIFSGAASSGPITVRIK